jgi:PAS domain S-box-containing protein
MFQLEIYRMNDDRKTKEQLIKELQDLQSRMAELEKSESEVKHRGELQHENEEKFFLAFKHAPLMAAITVLEDGTYLDVNDKFMEVGGFKREEVLGKTSIEVGWLRVEDRKQLIEAIQRQGKVADMEITCYAKDGRPIDCLYNFELVTIAGVKRLLTLGLDITERKRSEAALKRAHNELERSVAARTEKLRRANQELEAEIKERKRMEEALRKSEMIYQSLVDTTETGFVIIDIEGRVLDANAEYVRLSGHRDLADIRGRNVIEWTAEYEKGKNAEAVRLCAETGYIRNLEIDYLDSHGKVIPVEINATVVKKDGLPQIFTLCRDITERKRAEEQVSSIAKRLQVLLDVASDGVHVHDLDGNLIESSESFSRMLGYNKEEASNLNVADWDVKFKKEELHGIFQEHFNNQLIFETRHRRRDGTEFDVEINSRGIEIDGQPYIYASSRDITDRKKAEEALKESKQLLEKTFFSLREAVFIVNATNTEILDCNPAASEIFGYSREGLLGKTTAFLHVDEASLGEFRERLYPAIEEKGYLSLAEFKMKRKDGTVFFTEHSVTSLENKHGQRIAWVSVIRDISEAKRLEEALRDSEKRYRDLFENSTLAIFRSTIDGKAITVNPMFARLFGYESPEEILATVENVATDVFADPRRRSEIIRLQAENPRLNTFENLYRRKDGSTFLGRLNLRAIKELKGHVIIYEGFIEDITERKQAEEALRNSEKGLAAAQRIAHIGSWLWDVTANTALWSEETYRIFGIPYKHMEEHKRDFLDMVHPKDQDRVDQALRDALSGRKEYDIEYRIITPDRTDKIIHALAEVSRNDQGEPVLMQGTVHDITERKRAEEEKQNLVEKLQRAEKMESLGTLAGGVAHDLNNVLGIIVGYSQILLFDVDEASPLRPGLLNILDGSQRAAAIIQDLLTLARRGVRNRQVHNLNKIVIDIQKSPEFENLSSYHSSVKIENDLEPDLLNISGSSVHISKTIFNLISNASEAMPKGGTLIIKTSNQYLDRPIRGYDEVWEGDYVVLSVSDTGEGISAADLKRIFEPFYTKKVMGRSGTGLGLAVVWGTVKDHQGYINVQSEEGKGSTFTLYFPVTREEITAEAVAVSISEYLGKGETILIVDDVQGQRDLASTMLKKLDYSVTSVSSGEEAVDYLKEHKVDLLVLDMILDPGMDGLETFKKVLEIHPHQKAIIVSGFSESERVHAAQALGAGAYLRKPYVIETLGLAVRQELDRT